MRAVSAFVASLGLVLITACSTDQPKPGVPAGIGSASLAAGETLGVDIGWVNSSIGDSWYLVGEPDPAVLATLGPRYTTDPECDAGMSGCRSYLVWEFQAVGDGETTAVFQYCYRSGPKDCVADDRDDTVPPPEPLEFTVTVSG